MIGRPITDLTGERFYKFVVIERGGRQRNLQMWRCKCDCGKRFETTIKQIRRIKSCGCWRPTVKQEVAPKPKPEKYVGQIAPPCYWRGMLWHSGKFG